MNMKTAIRTFGLTAALACTASSFAQNDGFGDSPWYVSPMATYINEDTERLTNDGFGGHLGLGRNFAENWAIELNLVGNQLDGFDETNQWGVGIDLLRSFNQRGRFSPYVGVGTGFMKTQIVQGVSNNPALAGLATSRSDDENAFAHVAGGFLAQLGQSRAKLRGDVRYRADLADPDSFNDIVFNLGFVVPFGAPAEPPVYDSDGDGVIDGTDQCPGTPGGATVDSRGCELDRDADGVPDSRDACPDTRAGARVDGKGCEVERDSDRDGVKDASDRCPNTPRNTKVDAYGCKTIGDADGDGVLDNRDRCPNTSKGARVDVNGCEFKEEIQLRGVTFETNSATLTSTSLTILNDAAATLERNDDIRVEAQGHTDSQGADSYNLGLSQRRAEAVRDYLIRRGVDASRITAKGYGETQPVASNANADGRAENRRVVLKVLGQ